MTHDLPNGHIGVEVPEGISDIQIRPVRFTGQCCITYFIPDLGIEHLYLDGEDLSIVGLSDELTEEQWKGVVEIDNPEHPDLMFKCYLNRFEYWTTAKESGHSLLKHLKVQRLIILRKNN